MVKKVFILLFMLALVSIGYADIIGSVDYKDQFRYQTKTFDCFLIRAQSAELEIRATSERMQFVEEKNGWVLWSVEGSGIPAKTYNVAYSKDLTQNKIIVRTPAVDDRYEGSCNATIIVNFAAIPPSQIPYSSYPLIVEGEIAPSCAAKWRCMAGISTYQSTDCTFSNRTGCLANPSYNPSGICNENTGLCPTPNDPWPPVQPVPVQPARIPILSDVLDVLSAIIANIISLIRGGT